MIGTLFQPGAALALSYGLQPVSSVRIRVSQKLISVYRMHQPTLVSPCLLGDPCRVCLLHAPCQTGELCSGCRRGKAYECERAYPSSPAFVLSIASAVQLVKDGFAKFIHRNSALQLNFAQLVYLRDQSCRVDEHVVWQYVIGSRRARIAVDLGWGACLDGPQFRTPYLEIEPTLMAEAAQPAEVEHSVA